MAGTVKLTPAQLMAQADEMRGLEQDYEALFKSVTSELNSINGNWSRNLAHNFEGKIASAQRSFSYITSLLSRGASAAANSAKTFETVDSQLSKMMNGGATSKEKADAYTAGGGGYSSGGGGEGSFGDGKGGGGFRGGESFLEEFWSRFKEECRGFPDDIKRIQDDLKFLRNRYGDKIPGWAKKIYSAIVPDNIETAIKLTLDGFTGELSLGSISEVISFVSEGSLEGSVVINTLKVVSSEQVRNLQTKSEQDIKNQLMQGDILGAKFDTAEYVVDGLIGQSINTGFRVLGETVDSKLGDIVSLIPNADEIRQSLMNGKTAGDYISDFGAGTADAIDKTTDVLSDGVNFVTDKITETGKDAASFLYNLFK